MNYKQVAATLDPGVRKRCKLDISDMAADGTEYVATGGGILYASYFRN